MAEQKYISLAQLPGWLAELAASHVVYAPKCEGSAVVYRPYTMGDAVELTKKPTESAKHVLFPRSEELLSFKRQHSDEQGGASKVTLIQPEEPKPAVIFGALSCDARGFLAFDPVYNGSGTNGRSKDTYYLKRREQTVIIAKACSVVLSTCFCHWVGGAPDSRQGIDVLATKVADGFVLEAVTEKGAALVTGLDKAEADTITKAEAEQKSVNDALTAAPDLSRSKETLLACFDDVHFWEKETGGCLACGACTYLCPTCYCFNITDETNGLTGVRLRSWDSCMTSMFTLEASGHNPRVTKAARLKNRVGHKFSYYPNLHNGRFSCVGCGRCIKSCPSSVDIRRIVLNSIAHAGTEKESANG